MESLKKIKDIKSLINEFYHKMKCDNQLTNAGRECWKMYQNYCEEIKQDLERLKKIDDFKTTPSIAEYAIGRIIKLDIENEKLKQENKELLVNKNVAQGIATKYKQKLEQIEALPNCDICDENWHKGCMCLQKKIKEVLGNE